MFFYEVSEAPPDPIFGLTSAFRADPRPYKVDLLVGIYKNEELDPVLLPTVKRAKLEVFHTDLRADYLPIDGMREFIESLALLVFGEKRWEEIHGRTYGAQTAGGTAALRVGAEFLSQELDGKIYLPLPTWPNHRSVFEQARCRVDTYSYYHKKERRFDFEKMVHELQQLASKSVVLLHATCHNPTGCDPTEAEWRQISQICKEKNLLPFFDFAYQGLGDGMVQDRKAVEIFLQDGNEMMIAYSCSKNFSLYCQRVGALFIVDSNSATKTRIASQIKRIIRALYSNPPSHGAEIVRHILQSSSLYPSWLEEVEQMRMRIDLMRQKLVDRLFEKTDQFDSLRNHKGMFSFSGLDRSQVQKLIEDHAIYLVDSGRISVAGLNSQNLDSVAKAILSVL